jgi:hypothetical protein
MDLANASSPSGTEYVRSLFDWCDREMIFFFTNSTADDSMHLVFVRKEKLGEVEIVLSADSRDQCLFHALAFSQFVEAGASRPVG